MFGRGEEEVVSLAGILNSSRFHDDCTLLAESLGILFC